jgi:hypothetical protein
VNDFNMDKNRWDEIRKAAARPVWAAQVKTWQGGAVSAMQKAAARPVWAAQVKTWQGGQFGKMAEAALAIQRSTAQPVWAAQFKGTGFSKVVAEALAVQRFAALPAYNDKLFKGLTDFQFERAVEIAFRVVDAAADPSSMAAGGTPTSVPVDVPFREPLFPGLVDPWQQIRHWNLATWIAFVGVVATIVGILVTMGQARPQEGIGAEDIERIIRIIEQHPSPTSTAVPTTTNLPPSSKTSHALDSEQSAPDGRHCLPQGGRVRPVPR